MTKLQFDASISAYDHRYSEGFGASGKVKISLYSYTVHPDLVVKHNFVLDFLRCISTSLYTKCLDNYLLAFCKYTILYPILRCVFLHHCLALLEVHQFD